MANHLARKLAPRNLLADRFGTLCAIIGVALGTATVNTVLILDVNTRRVESSRWMTNPDLPVDTQRTIRITRAEGSPNLDPSPSRTSINDNRSESTDQVARRETHEDYQVMRSAIRLGSLSAYLVGALIVFFTFGVVVERRKREMALLRSLGAQPLQIAGIFIREALIVGVVGALLGILLAVPMSVLAAKAGITTTGRSEISRMWLPLRSMFVVGLIGALTALLGVLKPAREMLRLDVPSTLRPRFLAQGGPQMARRQATGVTLITLPFMALLYVLMRPFFRELIPSLAFFVLEAGLVCLAFLATLLLVPQMVRTVGGWVARLLPRGPAAERLLTLRRVEHMGHELAWSVSGVMLVFSLLLALHISTRSLKVEVETWAARAVRPYAFVYVDRGRFAIPAAYFDGLPDSVVQVAFSGRTPWPNSVYAVAHEDLVRLAERTGSPDQVALAQSLGPGRTILSRMMARRFGVTVGERLVIDNGDQIAQLEVAAITDELGYVPMVGPYRASKTYALIDEDDFGLIAPYAAPIGAAHLLADTSGHVPYAEWRKRLARFHRIRSVRIEVGARFERQRIRETDSDFAIFDVILLLTTVLAGVGIANNMVLSAHSRRREIALYRVLGMTVRQVRRMFMMEGIFIGLLGGGLAACLGVPLGYAAIGALKVVSAFPVQFDLPPMYLVATVAGAVAVSLAASAYPAWRAAGSSSAESVHYE